MKKYGLILLLVTLCIEAKNIGLTCKTWPGRLGDHIFYISKCLMLSHKYNIPFYYKPLKPLSQFGLHTQLEQLSPEIEKTFEKKVTIKHESYLPYFLKNNEDNILITIEFHMPTYDNPFNYWRTSGDRYAFIQPLLMPIDTSVLPKEPLPEDCLTVAVHVRKGSGTDGHLASRQLYEYVPEWKYIKKNLGIKPKTSLALSEQFSPETPVKKKRTISPQTKSVKPAADKINAKRFPPNQYYIECIKKLSELIDHQPLYIHIFTDDAHPQALVELFKKEVNLPNVLWHDRELNLDYKTTVLQDLYQMTEFDCIIKADSYFAWSAQFLGQHTLAMYPHTSAWKDTTLIIKTIGIVDFT